MRWRTLLFLAACACSVLNGQTFDAGGYLKYLYSHSSIPLFGELDDQLVHGRLNTRYYPTPNLTAALEIRGRIYYGDAVRKIPSFSSQIRTAHELEDLDLVLWDKHSSFGYMEVDRLWLDWTVEQFQLTVGRQRIAMGTNLVWNPIDLFNPFSILDFDYGERPGSDAARVQYFLGPLSKVEAAFKPGRTSSGSTAIVGWTGNAFDYDFHLVGGRRGDKWVASGAWAGDIGGGGFRGEILLAEIPEINPALPRASSDIAGTMVSSALSGDYTFPNSLYLHMEVLYNSEGVTAHTAFYQYTASALGLLSPARWSLFGEVSYMISPLVRASVFAIQNPSDKSRVFVPSATWSALNNLDVTIIALVFGGDSFTEYGDYGTSVYARAAWAF